MSVPMADCREPAVLKRGELAAACVLHQFELTTADAREDFPAGTRPAGPLDICGQHLRQAVSVGDVLARLDEVVNVLWTSSPRKGESVSSAFQSAVDDLAELVEITQQIAAADEDRVSTLREFRRGVALGQNETHLNAPVSHRRPGFLARLTGRRAEATSQT